MKLTDTQLVMLSAAAQREDRCLVPSPKLKGAVTVKAANKLISAGFVEEIEAEAATPMWRRDNETGQGYALKLTAAGLRGIARGADEQQETAGRMSSSDAVESESMPGGIDARDAGARVEAIRESARPRVPRAGTKIGEVIERLGREAGATIDEIVAATGWLPHTSRAALTGLRKRGYALVSDRSDWTLSTVYRIACGETSDEASRAAAAAPDRQGCSDAAPPRKQAAADRRRRRAS
jgi:hypothetical protein